MDIKTIIKYLWAEIHRGNLLVIAALVASYFWIVVPVYKWLEGHDDATAYIMQDLDILREELHNLKKDTKVELMERQSGKLGTTRH